MIKGILKKPTVGHYSNVLHFEFNRTASGLFEKHAAAIGAPQLIDDHRDSVEQERKVLNWVRLSILTDAKRDTDRKRQDAYIMLGGIVRPNLKHFDPVVRDAALQIYNIMAPRGYIREMGYDAKTACIDGVVKLLRDERCQPAVELLGLQTCINEIDTLNNEFKEQAEAVAQEIIKRPQITVREARQNTDFSLREVTGRVDALVLINGEGQLGHFASEYNVLVRHYNRSLNEHLGRLHARRDISDAVIAPIDPQYYTGKAITLIPEVTLLDPRREPIRPFVISPSPKISAYPTPTTPTAAWLR